MVRCQGWVTGLTLGGHIANRADRAPAIVVPLQTPSRASRIVDGGIHPPVDDFAGRRTGSDCGQAVWNLVQRYFDGSITNAPVNLAIRRLDPRECETRFNTIRGMYYKVQFTADLNRPFIDDAAGITQALESSMVRTNSLSDSANFFRVISSLAP